MNRISRHVRDMTDDEVEGFIRCRGMPDGLTAVVPVTRKQAPRGMRQRFAAEYKAIRHANAKGRERRQDERERLRQKPVTHRRLSEMFVRRQSDGGNWLNIRQRIGFLSAKQRKTLKLV